METEHMLWQFPKKEKDYIWRFDGNPLFNLSEMEDFWHICNSAVVRFEDGYVGVFRCELRTGRPDLFLGKSKDGIQWELENIPIVLHTQDGSIFTYPYAYDPRLILIDGIYYIVFCADIEGPSIYIAKTADFKRFEMLPMGFLPFNRNGVLFPEKIDGKYIMLSRPSDSGHTPFGNIYISESSDLVHWGNHKLLMKNFHLGDNFWERVKIGAGPTPIKTEEGWILIYHGVQATCNGLSYSIGVALLDLDDPSKVIARADRYLLTAEENYEKCGFTSNVCFPCSAIVDDDRIAIYYGVADSNMAIAFTTKDKLLEFVHRYNR